MDRETINISTGEYVMKSGRTTGYTMAKVIDTSATIMVGYGLYMARFRDVILTEKFLEPGDSGSAVWAML